MTRFAIVDADEPIPANFPLWLTRGDVEWIEWNDDHGDEGVYVVSGEVEVDGRLCPAGGAVIVEAGVPARMTGRAHVVRMGSRATPRAGGQIVHVIGPGGTWAKVEEGRDTRYFADSECPTCDITLFVTGRARNHESPIHSHSSDELIHVLDGSITVGKRVAGAGSTLVIAAGQRYGFKSDGFSFLNYRPGVATMTVDKNAPPIDEGGRAHGFDAVMDVR
jgi:quercetin dioxygenase-like cupin family protein